MTSLCRWLHEKLERRPLVQYPFDLNELPLNGIYFFYEHSEVWGHSGEKPRIVRVGTHKSNNFRSRINEHFLLDDRWMNFTSLKPAPKDRSIFRKNLGRVILNSEFPEYLKIWNISFIKSKNKKACARARRRVSFDTLAELGTHLSKTHGINKRRRQKIYKRMGYEEEI